MKTHWTRVKDESMICFKVCAYDIAQLVKSLGLDPENVLEKCLFEPHDKYGDAFKIHGLAVFRWFDPPAISDEGAAVYEFAKNFDKELERELTKACRIEWRRRRSRSSISKRFWQAQAMAGAV